MSDLRPASEHMADWLRLRAALWPECRPETHRLEIEALSFEANRFCACLAFDAEHRPVGLIEASIRHDYVNGTESSPVGFVEGVYVRPEARGQGFGRLLINHAIGWMKGLGCTEVASDALLDNRASHAFHHALGFEETERVVFFRKRIM